MTETTQAAAAQDTTAATQAEAGQSEGSVLTPQNSSQQAATDGTQQQQGDQAAAGEDDAGKASEKADQGNEQDNQQEAGAPEEYADFSLPEGVELDADVLTEFKAVAKELGISQEAAQKLVDLQASMENKRAESLQQALADQSQQWANEIRNDPELGGDKFDKTVELAVKTIETFASPELRTLLNDSGLGNHPELVKFCHRIGKAISEDSLVLGGTQTETGARKKTEDVFYPASN